MPIVLAAVAAQTLNRPVKVIFNREDDMGLEDPRTATLQHLTAMLSGNGNVIGLKHDVVAGWIGFELVNIPAADNKGKIEGLSYSGADHWYDIQIQHVTAFRNEFLESVMPLGAVRSVSNNYTVFAVESFLD